MAAILILLYAQSVTRISGLTIDDLIHEGPDLLIALGDPPSPVPEPFASLLTQYVKIRPNTTTATNPNARWLFPGRRAGQPLTPTAIEGRLRRIGITARTTRTSAIRQLVLQAPAPVVAGMLGYHHETTTRLASAVASPWSHYAPGDHG